MSFLSNTRGGKARGRPLNVLFYVLAGAVFLLAAVMNYRYLGMTLERVYTPLMPVHADFDTFRASARAFLDGGDAYRTGNLLENLNPPFWVLLTVPFALLEPLAGYRLFAALMAVLAAVSLLWMGREARVADAVGPLGASLAVVALLVSSPLLATLALGQMYPVLALGLVAAWVADRRGRDVASGIALGLVVALKPSLAPVLLWPLVRRRWGSFGAALVSGAAATLVGAVALGPRATLEWAGLLLGEPLSPYWDNASLPGTAARLFTGHEFSEPLAVLPWAIPLFGAVGLGLILLTALRARGGSEGALWALAAASLLASPIAWHNYLIVLAPGVMLLLARGRVAVALLLVSFQLIPPAWPLIWRPGTKVWTAVGPEVAALAMSLYLVILLAHWVAFLTHGDEAQVTTPEVDNQSPAAPQRAG